MRHLHDELLAGIALDEPDELTRRDRLHLLLCRHCAPRLSELQRLVATGRAGEPGPLRAPRPGLLAAIQAELAGEAGHDVARTTTLADPAPNPAVQAAAPVSELSERRRPRYAARLAAAAAVAVVAVGGTLWYRAAETGQVVARATLTALPDKSGAGTARLTSRGGAEQLSIDVQAPSSPDAFHELWLINVDGKQMISLGVVPPGGRATYPVPPATGKLAGYTIVDISIEPYDGNAEHSHNSLLRGNLG